MLLCVDWGPTWTPIKRQTPRRITVQAPRPEPDVSSSHLGAFKIITHCNCNRFAPIRSRGVTAPLQLFPSKPISRSLSTRRPRLHLVGNQIEGSHENSHYFASRDGPPQPAACDCAHPDRRRP